LPFLSTKVSAATPISAVRSRGSNQDDPDDNELTGINNLENPVGFYLSKTGGIFGFIESHNIWRS
jgi:hypothetical protein